MITKEDEGIGYCVFNIYNHAWDLSCKHAMNVVYHCVIDFYIGVY